MLFCGLGKVFSTRDDGQYVSIGEFWDIMAGVYGRDNLQGLGYGWTESSITYVIGLKSGSINKQIAIPGAAYREINLPDGGWIRYTGKTEQLARLYDRIYSEGNLKYEIEQFSEDGNCEIFVIRA